jgi:hypothetical protein
MRNVYHALKNLFKILEVNHSLLIRWLSLGLPIFLSSFYFSPSLLFLKWVYVIFFLLPTIFLCVNHGFTLLASLRGFLLLILPYTMFVFFSTFWSDSPKIFDIFYNSFFFLAFFFGTTFLALNRGINTNLICNSIIITGAITGSIICIYFYSNECWTDRLWLSGWFKIGPTNPNHIAVNYSVSSLLALLFLTYQNQLKRIFIYFFLALLNIFPLIATQCRGALLSFIFTIIIYCIFININKRAKIIFLVCFGIFIMVFLKLSFNNPHSFIAERIYNNGFRKEIWTSSVMYTVQNNFLIGEGRGGNEIPVELPTKKRFHTFQHAHNQFIDAFYFTGLIGFCIFVAINIYIIIGFSTSPVIFPFYIWFLNGLFCSFTNGSARTLFGFWWFGFWIPIGLIGAFLLQKRVQRQTICSAG